ncbi:MAG TPA: holo-ACP synthase [Mycobacteriales bacterium]|jgi:holo-[acyl-carrier protein] synthase|nr:holo-ACP synthase [Mycobacteriales bacterium]
MTIVGIGVDIVDVARFEKSLQRTPGLRDRLFTDGERVLPVASLAGRFAAKEALAKALGAPGGLAWHDAEVVTDDTGRPSLLTRASVADAAAAAGVGRWHLSISHDAGSAVAMVVAEATQ